MLVNVNNFINTITLTATITSFPNLITQAVDANNPGFTFGMIVTYGLLVQLIQLLQQMRLVIIMLQLPTTLVVYISTLY